MDWKQHFYVRRWARIFLVLAFVAVAPAGAIEAPSVEWQNHYDVGGDEGEIYWQYNPNGAIESADGGYFLVTTSMTKSPESHYSPTSKVPTEDVLLLKLDSFGNISWKKFFGGSDDEKGAGIAPAGDGGLVIVGSASSASGELAGIDTRLGDMSAVRLGTGATT